MEVCESPAPAQTKVMGTLVFLVGNGIQFFFPPETCADFEILGLETDRIKDSRLGHQEEYLLLLSWAHPM